MTWRTSKRVSRQGAREWGGHKASFVRVLASALAAAIEKKKTKKKKPQKEEIDDGVEALNGPAWCLRDVSVCHSSHCNLVPLHTICIHSITHGEPLRPAADPGERRHCVSGHVTRSVSKIRSSFMGEWGCRQR